MYWLPARPSPMAAPMAPPPSAMPPPTMAPASVTAWFMFSTAIACSLLGVSVLRGGTAAGKAGLVPLLVHGEAEVHDRQQREDQRLDHTDEHVEQLPDDVRKAEDVRREEPDQRDHQAAGEEVTEQSQCQRERLGELLDGTERDEPARGTHEALDVAEHALLAHPDEVHPQQHDDGECCGQVDVGGRRDEGLVRGHDLHPVRDEDEGEQ